MSRFEFTLCIAVPLLVLALLAALPAQLLAEPRIPAPLEAEATMEQAIAFAPSADREDAFLPESKKEAIASLAVPRATSQTADTADHLEIALAPSTDREDAFLPESKKEAIASLIVPELAPRVAKKVLPRYPEYARKARLQGMVYARVLVDTSGKVVRIGPIGGHAIFHKAVETAAMKWEFTPAMQGKLPVRTWVTVPFSFEL